MFMSVQVAMGVLLEHENIVKLNQSMTLRFDVELNGHLLAIASFGQSAWIQTQKNVSCDHYRQ